MKHITIEGNAVSLAAYRCPDATVYMRMILCKFRDTPGADTLTLDTIEPSMRRSINALLATSEFESITVGDVHTRAISEADKALWEPNFDDDDYGDVSEKTVFELLKPSA